MASYSLLGRELETRVAVERDVDREALRGEPALERTHQAALVVHHENPHVASMPPGTDARSPLTPLSGCAQRPWRTVVP